MQLLALEVVFILAGLYGVACWSVPAALVLAGVLGVWACERAAAETKRVAEEQRKNAAGGDGR